jgi:phosphoadenosine phosphosulfate reductase
MATKQLDQKIEQLVTALTRASKQYNSPAFSTSYSVEDMILLDLIAKNKLAIKIFTIDTGRLPEKTYALMDKVCERYAINVDVYFPDTQAIQELVHDHGHNGFYDSVEVRKTCCQVRKVEPLQRALKGRDAWITGLRRQQSPTRENLRDTTWDETWQLQKLNPLLEWSHQDVWAYVVEFDVPYNALYDSGYASIGCAPCTRAIADGEDIRAGRWWWEAPESRECGLHTRRLSVVSG